MFKHQLRFVLCVLLLLGTVVSARAQAPGAATSGNGATAPEIPSQLTWVNTLRAHSLQEFRGRFVLLDFWTLGCINCIHILPDLKRLEQEYPQELVVIGIHSGKFQSERVSSQIKLAAERFGISHPVVNDERYELWNAYGVHVWPTVVLIDPKGEIILQRSGEGVYAATAPVLARAVESARNDHTLVPKPNELVIRNEEKRESGSGEVSLRFPGKITVEDLDADEQSRDARLAVSDTGNNRVLIIDRHGALLESIGGTDAGFVDGDFHTARFSEPQGLAFRGDTLYVADRANHAIREIDLRQRSVRTLFGDGHQRGPSEDRVNSARMSSPWDVALQRDTLWIAMAGAHQIWRADLKRRKLTVAAGTGAEGVLDGPALAATLAQPSGLSVAGDALYFADSESSAIRVLKNNTVFTIVGKGLFDFGDRDGAFPAARLQHPLGLAAVDDVLYVVDTYNSKLKRLTLLEKTVGTLQISGDSQSGAVKSALLNQPSGIVRLGDELFITDTNDHAVKVYNLRAKSLTPLHIAVRPQVLQGASERQSEHEANDSEIAAIGERVIAPVDVHLPAKGGELQVQVHIPAQYVLADEAPSSLSLVSPGDDRVFDESLAPPFEDRRVKLDALPQSGKLNLHGAIYFCEKAKSLCHIDRFYQAIAFSRSTNAREATSKLAINVQIPTVK